MKLAEAMDTLLMLEAQLDNLREEVLQAAAARASGRPGDEDLETLLEMADDTIRRIVALRAEIGRTVALATFPDGTPVLEALARHARLNMQHDVLSAAALAAATALCLPTTEAAAVARTAPLLTDLWRRTARIAEEREEWREAVLSMARSLNLAAAEAGAL